MNLRHLEWLIGEPVPDPEMIRYEVQPYVPAQADRIIEQLCGLAGLEVGQANCNPLRAERVRQSFGLIVDGARARQALLDLSAVEIRLGKPPWRDLLKELRHDRRRFATAIRNRSARIALRWALGDLGLAGRVGPPLAASPARQPGCAAQDHRPGAGGSAATAGCRTHRSVRPRGARPGRKPRGTNS